MIIDDDPAGDWTAPGIYRCAPGVYRIPLPLPNDGLRAVPGAQLAVEGSLVGLHGVDRHVELGRDRVGEHVKVIHSLTSMGCPAGPMIQEDIHNATAAVEGVEEVEVELTFDPPWTPEKMSDDAKFILGFG